MKKSLEKNLNDKFVSPFWGAFILSWLAWNWRIWYITFFIDSDLLMQSRSFLKIDYILSFYPASYFWFIVYSMLPSLIFSYIAVFWLSKITKLYYKQALDNEYEEKILKERKERDFLREKEEKLTAEVKVLTKEEEVENIKTKTQDEKWDEEYEKFKKSKYFNSFNIIKQRIYESGGYIGGTNRIPSDITSAYDANGIIEGSSNEGNRIKITDKGKYFIKKITEEN
ncbi:MAG: hypothetical protein WCI36_05230 [bacterium]